MKTILTVLSEAALIASFVSLPASSQFIRCRRISSIEFVYFTFPSVFFFSLSKRSFHSFVNSGPKLTVFRILLVVLSVLITVIQFIPISSRHWLHIRTSPPYLREIHFPTVCVWLQKSHTFCLYAFISLTFAVLYGYDYVFQSSDRLSIPLTVGFRVLSLFQYGDWQPGHVCGNSVRLGHHS